jgi:hypothetical protein
MLHENEWVLAEDELLRDALAKLTPRQSRLLAAACCRLLTDYTRTADTTVRTGIEAVEAFADGRIAKATLKRTRQFVWELRYVRWQEIPVDVLHSLSPLRYAVSDDVAVVRRAVIEAMADLGAYTDREETRRRLVYGRYRDVAGAPADVAFDPARRTDTVLTLARQMYESGDFGAMPILADALQDAGCADDRIGRHCRGPEKPNDGYAPSIPTAPFVHVRGCWVVDLVLGKA